MRMPSRILRFEGKVAVSQELPLTKGKYQPFAQIALLSIP